ncbi:hypothetical protein FO519_006143 [Halicephalobus sp. NKZ332]|nr:hypothetical protein FO519_006143 [Halicephalobus sp. NKZ332]
MATPWPGGGTANGNLDKQPCDRDSRPSTSSWPSTELALETPERNRWRYKRRSDNVYSTPPRRFSSSISPKTPRMKRQRHTSPTQIPGKCLINSSPSPLRRFRISQSCFSFTASTEKKKDRIEYRIGGNSGSQGPLFTINDTLDEKSRDGGNLINQGFLSTVNDTLDENLVMGIFTVTFLTVIFWITVSSDTFVEIDDEFPPNNENHIRVKRSNDTTSSEYVYYSNDATTEEPPKPRYLLFGVMMALSCIVILIQIAATILIPTLPDLPIRWHTLNYCCWNIFQLLIFANCASESSLQRFLKNTYISDNCADIQRMTLSIFLYSMVLQVPATAALHFFPKLSSAGFYRFYVWIPVYFFLDLGIFLVYGSEPWSWRGKDVQIVPIQAFQTGAVVFGVVFFIILIICVIIGIVHYIVYACQYMGRPDSELTSYFVRLINFVLFVAYMGTILFVHMPVNSLNMGTFLAPYIYEWILPYIQYFIDMTITILQINEFTTLLVPLVEFVATWVLIPQYRDQLLYCCSCGLALSKPKPITRPVIPFKKENFNKIEPISENRPAHPGQPHAPSTVFPGASTVFPIPPYYHLGSYAAA